MRSKKQKVGRNDQCPCGSGLKYKRCCLTSEEGPLARSLGSGEWDNALSVLYRSMAQFDRLELLSSIGALELIRENQGLLVDLELLAQAAAGCPGQGTAECSSSAIRRLFGSPFIAQHRGLRDPIDGLFAESVVGPGGQYVLFPGLFSEGGFTLRTYLNAAFRAPEGVIPRSLLAQTKEPALALLSLSNCLARRWGYDGWLPSSSNDQSTETLSVPSEEIFRQLKTSMTFSLSDLAAEGISIRALMPFLLTQSHAFSVTPDIECHPLKYRPLVVHNGQLVVVSPTSFLSAIRNFLLETSRKLGIEKFLRSRLLEAVSWHIHRACIRLQMESCMLPASVGTAEYGRELLYAIDDDKACLVYVMPSEVGKFSRNIMDRLSDRLEAVCKSLSTSMARGGVLCVIVLIDGYERTLVRLRSPNIAGHVVVMNAEEFELISMDCSGDPLALWRYCKAKAASPEINSHSFFSCWSFYRKHRDSFYNSDGPKPSFILVSPGFEQERRCKIRVDWGLVAGPSPDPSLPYFVELQRLHGHEVPIFIPDELEQLRLGMVVRLRSIWFWVSLPTDESGHDLPRSFSYHLMQTLSFWIWQLGQPLIEILSAMGLDHVRLNTTAFGEWALVGASSGVEPAVDADARFEGERAATVTVIVRSSFSELLRSPDNIGEGQILRVLMRALVKMGSEQGLDSHLWSEFELQVDGTASAALGPPTKKMLLIIPESLEPLTDPRDLPPPRTLAPAYIDLHAGGLVDELMAGDFSLVPESGKDVLAIERGKVVRAVQEVYLRRLRSRLKCFSGRALLERLVAWNERLVREERFELFTAPTQAACWRGIQAQVDYLVERRSNLASTAHAVRFLVEFTATEPPDGSRTPSWDDMDDLAALAYQFINWGYTGEQIRTGLADHRLSWLESGRIGVGGELRDWQKDFMAADSHEILDDAHEALGRYYQPTDPTEGTGEYRRTAPIDEAFAEEFGISMTALGQIAATVRDYCEQVGDMSFARVPIAKLRQLLESTSGLEAGMLEPLLESFALRPGMPWDAPGRVTERRDIEPWHFNRRWSYLHRPIVVVQGAADELEVLVGPRHLLQAVANLHDSVFSGRYTRNAKRGGALHRLSQEAGKEKGIRFQDTLAAWFRKCGTSNLRIEPTVQLRPGKPLSPDRDLGDVDVLVLDFDTQTAFVVEAKDVNAGRTPSEMSSERESLTQRKGSNRAKPSASDRHFARAVWMANHWVSVAELYNLPEGKWLVKPVTITREEVVSQYVDEPPVPIRSFAWLRRSGFDAIRELLPSTGALVAEVTSMHD